MRYKSIDLMNGIIEFIDNYYCENGRIPTYKQIANNFNLTEMCISKYIKEMEEKGMIERQSGNRGIMTKTILKKLNTLQLPIVGSIACGVPLFAEENIEGYLSVSSKFLGNGKFFVFWANGESMINAGVNDGDYIIVKQQETAEQGQIVVALIDDEATLKRYYIDNRRKKIRLHPENDAMQDMYFDKIQIQGVAVKVIKDLS